MYMYRYMYMYMYVHNVGRGIDKDIVIAKAGKTQIQIWI